MPATTFTGHARDLPLALTVLHPTVNKSLSFIKAQQLAEVSKFTTQIEQLQNEVSTQVSRQRRKQMEVHKSNTNLVQPNFHPVDYVLQAVPKMRQHKHSLTWKCPYVVTKVYDNHTLRLRSLLQDVTFTTHVTRARIYRNADHDLRQEMLLCVTRTRVPYIASTTLVHRNIVNIVISNAHSLLSTFTSPKLTVLTGKISSAHWQN
jgi:hypothetical protein